MLKDKVIVITGASRGIGEAIALACVQAGARVVLASRKQADLEKRVENLSKEIGDFEKEIAQRKEEIARLEEDHRETTRAKERLELAERNGESKDAQKSGKDQSGKAEPAKAGP